MLHTIEFYFILLVLSYSARIFYSSGICYMLLFFKLPNATLAVEILNYFLWYKLEKMLLINFLQISLYILVSINHNERVIYPAGFKEF